ncbi:hypothetical protein M5689_007696 [Euphorbia peplus]|nr:hypothetical protein M5689_007696 [Euphorbia peplus]
MGGARIRKAAENNKALLMKILWRMWKNPDALWFRLLYGKYKKDEVFGGINGRVKCCSFLWKSISTIFKEFCNGICWKVGNGKDILFWTDNWLNGVRPIDICFVPPPENYLFWRVADVVDANGA